MVKPASKRTALEMLAMETVPSFMRRLVFSGIEQAILASSGHPWMGHAARASAKTMAAPRTGKPRLELEIDIRFIGYPGNHSCLDLFLPTSEWRVYPKP